MKTFMSVFLAILAAAAVIAVIYGVGQAFDDLNRRRAETEVIKMETERLKKFTEEINREREALEIHPPSTPGLPPVARARPVKK
jgi:hypothetical protein